jgi:hypothetical protein
LYRVRLYAKLTATNGLESRMESSVRNVVLLCEGCGERTVLGAPFSVWHSGSTSFRCECGARLELSHQLDPSEVNKQAETRTSTLYR